MKVYFASNFVLMRYIDKEMEFRKKLTEQYGECHRLFSFFFTKEIVNVVNLAKQEHGLKVKKIQHTANSRYTGLKRFGKKKGKGKDK